MRYNNTHRLPGLISLLIAILFPINIFAVIRGQVTSDDGESLPGAAVSIINETDSTTVGEALAGRNGIFEFTSLEPEGKLIKIYFPGFETYTAKANTANNIKLTPTSNELEEVVVSAERNRWEVKAGSYIYTPSDLALSRENALEAIKMTPLLNKNSGLDDALSIFSCEGNAKIYINGKEPQESTEAVLSMLKSLPPSSVKRVEIITDPGAMVEPGFNGGIINIEITDPTDGYYSTVWTSMNSKLDSAPSESAGYFWGYKSGKNHLSLSANYNGIGTMNESRSFYDYKEERTTIENKQRDSGWRNYITGNVNYYYDISPKALIGLSISSMFSEAYSRERFSSINTSPAGKTESHSQIRTVTPGRVGSWEFSPYFTYYLDNSGSYIELKYYIYPWKNIENKDFYFNDRISETNQLDGFNTYGRLKFVKKLSNYASIRGGADFWTINVNNKQNSSEFGFDRFKKKENSINAYFQYNQQIGDRFSFQAGVYYYFLIQRFYHLASDHHFKKIMPAILPNLSVNYNFPGNNVSISASYRRYMYCPGMESLNPMIYITSPNTGYTGNADLKKYIHNTYRFQVFFLKHFFFIANYNQNTNSYREYITHDSFTLSVPKQGGKERNLWIGLKYNNEFFNIWSFSTQFTPQYRHAKVKNNPSASYHYWDVNFMVSNDVEFIPGKKYFLSLNYFYTPKTISSSSTSKSYHYLNFGFSKRFDFGGTISFYANNLLLNRNENYYDSDTYGFSSKTIGNLVNFSLGFQYTFGNTKVKAARNTLNDSLDG